MKLLKQTELESDDGADKVIIKTYTCGSHYHQITTAMTQVDTLGGAVMLHVKSVNAMVCTIGHPRSVRVLSAEEMSALDKEDAEWN